MPALPTELTDFLTRIKDSLSVGPALTKPPVTIRGAAANYLRAQDLFTALELMQGMLDTVNLTATGGTTTTVVDGAATFVAGRQIGNTVTFVGGPLAGETAVVVDNSTTTLAFGSTLPSAPGGGQDYFIRGTMFNPDILSLREGKLGPFAAPPGNPYGTVRISTDALIRALLQWGGALSDIEQTVSQAGLETIAGSTTHVIQLNTTFRIDQLKGRRLTVGGNSGIITTNSETAATVSPAMVAPGAGAAVVITMPENTVNSQIKRLNPHPGGQPGENLRLAFMIARVEALLTAVVLPT